MSGPLNSVQQFLYKFFRFKMSATGRSYTKNFLKVQYVIIQTTLGRKLMKKITVTDEEIFRVYKVFDRKK